MFLSDLDSCGLKSAIWQEIIIFLFCLVVCFQKGMENSSAKALNCQIFLAEFVPPQFFSFKHLQAFFFSGKSFCVELFPLPSLSYGYTQLNNWNLQAWKESQGFFLTLAFCVLMSLEAWNCELDFVQHLIKHTLERTLAACADPLKKFYFGVMRSTGNSPRSNHKSACVKALKGGMWSRQPQIFVPRNCRGNPFKDPGKTRLGRCLYNYCLS